MNGPSKAHSGDIAFLSWDNTHGFCWEDDIFVSRSHRGSRPLEVISKDLFLPFTQPDLQKVAE